MYKSSKSWVVKSTLSFVSGLVLFGVSQSTVVKADDTAGAVSQFTAEVSATQGQNTGSTVAKTDISVEGDAGKSGNGTTVDKTVQKDTGTTPVPQQNAGTTLTPQPIEEQPAENSDTPAENDKSILGTNWSISDDGNLQIENGTLNEMTDGVSPWTDAQKQSVNKITFGDQVTAGKSVAGLFQNFSNVTEVDNQSGFKTGATTDMSNLFSGCSSLNDIDLSGLDFSNATNLKNMFYGDKSLSNLKLPKNVSNNVSDKSTLNFTGMFSGDSQLKSLDLTPLDMSATTDTKGLLSGDSNLVMLALSGKDKLTDLNVGARNNRNISMGYTGWLTPDDGMTSTSAAISTDKLIDMYADSKEVDKNPMIWINHNPDIVSVYEKDTNGKLLKLIKFYLPIGDSTADTADIEKKYNELSESKELILGDTDSTNGSYFEGGGLPGKNLITNADLSLSYEKGLVKYVVDSKAQSERFLIYDMKYDGSRENFYFVYPPVPEKSINSSAPDREIQGLEERVGTFYDKPDVQLYDDSGSELTDRKLSPNSDWFTDESMSLNGVKYYRVATNEWTRAKDVYLYYPNSTNVLVNKGTVATLVTAEGKAVTDRALQANSSWFTDRYTYINNAKYYRVSTNEFVSADDVQEY